MNKGLCIFVRALAIVLLLGAIAWGVEVLRQVHESDDGGPPLGAIIMSIPSLILLIAAGAAWSVPSRYPGNQRGN